MKDDTSMANDRLIISGFLKRLLKLLFYGIKPIVVFDGKVIDLKRKEVMRRRDLRLS